MLRMKLASYSGQLQNGIKAGEKETAAKTKARWHSPQSWFDLSTKCRTEPLVAGIYASGIRRRDQNATYTNDVAIKNGPLKRSSLNPRIPSNQLGLMMYFLAEPVRFFDRHRVAEYLHAYRG